MCMRCPQDGMSTGEQNLNERRPGPGGVSEDGDEAPVPTRNVQEILDSGVGYQPTATAASCGSSARGKGPQTICRDPGMMDPDLPRFAFLIGNNNYSDESDKLIQPCRDARAMSEQLQQLNFRSEVHLDQEKRGMEERFMAWRNQLPSTCVAVLFLAGHGFEVEGENYFVPIDAPDITGKADADRFCVPLQWMLGSLVEKLTKDSLVIVLLDCCRENPQKARGMRARGSRNYGQGLADVNMSNPEEARMFVGYAAGPGKFAMEGKQQHGVFTQALLKALRDDALAQEDIRSKFFGSVIDYVDQTQKDQRPEQRNNMARGFAFKRL